MRDPAFEAIVTRLCADDPAFARRVGKSGSPRSTTRVVLAVLLWTIAPGCVIVGGATGLLMAIGAAAYGSHLMWSRAPFPATVHPRAGVRAPRPDGT